MTNPLYHLLTLPFAHPSVLSPTRPLILSLTRSFFVPVSSPPNPPTYTRDATRSINYSVPNLYNFCRRRTVTRNCRSVLVSPQCLQFSPRYVQQITPPPGVSVCIRLHLSLSVDVLVFGAAKVQDTQQSSGDKNLLRREYLRLERPNSRHRAVPP